MLSYSELYPSVDSVARGPASRENRIGPVTWQRLLAIRAAARDTWLREPAKEPRRSFSTLSYQLFIQIVAVP